MTPGIATPATAPVLPSHPAIDRSRYETVTTLDALDRWIAEARAIGFAFALGSAIALWFVSPRVFVEGSAKAIALTLLGVSVVVFVLMRVVPGDPVEVRVGERGISPERLAMFRHELGLDQPVWKQFLDYAGQLLHGDFGTSLATNQKVLTEFAALFPATLELDRKSVV